MSVWQHPKHRVYYIREAVPLDLQQRAGTKTYKRSLRTTDKAEAKRRYPDQLSVFNSWLDSLRNGPLRLSAAQVEALVGVWYRRQLDQHSDDPGSPGNWEAASESLPTGDDPSDEVARDKLLGPMVDGLLDDEGIDVDAATRAYLAQRLFRRMLEVYGRLDVRAGGDFSPDPTLVQFPPWENPKAPKAVPAVTFPAMLDRWKSSAPIREKTVAEYGAALKAFELFVGHDDPSRVETDDVERWRDSLIASGLKTKTVQGKYLAAISAIYRSSQGKGKGRLQGNPVDGAWFRGRKFADSVQRRPYSAAELSALLQAARHETLPERRWLPWLMAYTGLRFREAVQSLASDIRERDGIVYIDVNEDQPFKRLKAKPGVESPSIRDVPLHSALVAEGFVDYARALPSGAFLFPRVKPRADGRANEGRPVDSLRRWMASHASVGTLSERRKLSPTHSLRHAFEDLLREATPDYELRRDIQGREDGSSARGYGDGHALQVKFAAISRIQRIL